MSNEMDKRDLLISTAKMYYEDGLSQKEIAERIHVSRPTVSRLLKASRREGIVHIRIGALPMSTMALGKRIESR